MTQKPKLKVVFGEAYHGWIPRVLTYKGFSLEVTISDVPIDPMEQLCTALIELMKGISKPIKVIWHLEPYCYYLELEKIGQKYKMILSESKSFDSPMTLTKMIEGDFETLILPLYRALKSFYSYTYQPPHWALLEVDRIIELTNLIKDKKRSLNL